MLFLTDSVGAFFTAFFLFFVLRNFPEYFGMPVEILTALAIIAACFMLYSACCYVFHGEKVTLLILIISFANLAYCVLTLSLMIIYAQTLTLLGLVYFSVEITLVCMLAYVEIGVVRGKPTQT